MVRSVVVGMVLVLASCGSTKNPDFCCLDEQDCAQFGETEFRSCPEGLACVDNACAAPTCVTGTCSADAPVCVVVTDTCAGCASNDDCARFAAAPTCDVGTGGCVQCTASTDCPQATPVCDAKQCRTCSTDDECVSGACRGDGTCVGPDDVIYVAPAGVDSGSCTASAPCATLAFALVQITDSREHVVMAPGDYTGRAQTAFPASHVYIHGHGARLAGGDADTPTLGTTVPTDMEDLEVINTITNGIALFTRGVTTLERVRLSAHKGISAFASVTAVDVIIDAVNIGVAGSTNFVFNRVQVHGGEVGVQLSGGTIDFTNVLIYDSNGPGIDAQGTTGTFKFGTIARTGRGGGPDAFGVACSGASIAFQGSIVWSMNVGARPPVSGCSIFVSTIAGPNAVAGAMNVDPLFANLLGNDFQLQTNSPARDAVDTGPSLDLNRVARPRGVRFDLGALEAP